MNMSNEFEGKKQIENPEEFKGLVENNKKDFSNCVFMFAFENSDRLISALTDERFSFNGAVFYEEVTFSKDVMSKDISIDNPINLSGAKFKKTVIFDSVNFNDNFFATGCTFNEIKFSNVTCKKSVLFNSIKSIRNFTAKNCTFHDFEFLSSPITKLILEENSFLGKFKVSHNDREQRNYRSGGKKVEIEELIFKNNTIAPEKLVRFGYLDVDCFHFENMNNPIGSEINIGECDFCNFTISHVRNAGRLIVYRMNEKVTGCGDLVLKDSHLGNSDLQNVNLECYRLASIKNSLLSDMTYTGVQWPRPDNIELDKKEKNEKKRDKYRTLKNVAQKNNDAPRAIAFYAKEMEAYSHTLSWEKGQRIDKIILLFNKWTNGFGLNWWLPILWILGFGFVLYLLLLLSIDSNDCCICKEWKKFPVFLNPTHKTGVEFICGQWGFWAYLFDLSFRIIEATLLYQTIIAFRKFTRKL